MANSLADFLHSYSLRVFDNLPVPILTVTGEGTAGTTTYEYKATFKTIVGESLPSDVATLSTGNATLTGFNKNRLSVLEIPPATTKVRYWKNAWTYFSQTLRENSTGYDLGDYMVTSSNNLVRFQCTTAGTSASSDPGSWPTTLGNTKVDGTVVWTAVTNKNDTWVLLGEVDPDPGQLYDTGQATTSATIPTTDTSGRPGVIAILPKPGTMIQRAERIDTMSLYSQMVQDGFDLIHKSGDVISGCSEYQIDGNLWGFTSGKIYFLGRFIDVPAGQVTLTGSGEEKVGITITPLYVTADDDYVWRCGEDEGVAGEYANTGPDVLYFQFAWVKDNDAQVTIKEFVDGVPKTATLPPERTPLDRVWARRSMALSGSFVVENFPLQVVEHATDDEKLTLKIGAGYAFPNGFEVKTVGTRTVDFNKAREVKAVNNSGTEVFNIPGAINEWNYWEADTVVAQNTIRVPSILNGYRYKCTAVAGDEESGSTEPTWPETPGETVTDNDLTWTCLGDDYDLNTLALTVQVGSGNEHTLTFAADNLTAAQVVTAIEAEFNAYPTSGEPDLVNGIAADAILQLRADYSKSLTLSGTALAQLGWAAGTTLPEGTRIYKINNQYVKNVTDLNYRIQEVIQLTHNGTTHKDLLGDNVVSILGASKLGPDAHDSKWDYEDTVDFVKDGNYISFAGTSGSDEPGSGTTYYVKCEKNYNATKGARHLVRVIDAKVVKTGEDLADNLTFTDATSITRVNGGTAVVPTGTPTDVVRILRVNNSPGQSADQYTSYSLLKNSGALTHETSQVDWSEAGTQGTTGAGQPSDSATYYVSYEFWHHYTEGDFVCADSYDDYVEIELAPNDGWPLRDCLDFRTSGSVFPKHGEDPTFDYEFYLARVDKLTIDDLANFQLMTGAAAIEPPTPSDQNGTLSIAILRIPPYTYTPSSVSIVSVEPVRITQKGIQRLQERIERLEYWQAVNGLESEAEGIAPEGADTQGIFTDALTGWGRMDLTFNKNGITCNAALDRVNQNLLLNYDESKKLVEVDENNSLRIRRAGNSVMLDYQPSVFMEQPKASVWVNGATDYDYSNYFGRMEITPQNHVWLDSAQLPQINVDFDNQFTALIDVANQYLAEQPIDWSAWTNGEPNTVREMFHGYTTNVENSGYGTMLANHNFGYFSYGAGMNTTSRTGTSTTLVPGAITRETINAVADLSLQYYMSTTDADGNPFEIELDIIGLMPNVDHACTINGIPVDLTYNSSPVNASGTVGTNTYLTKTTARTSNIGSLTAKFTMPSGVLTGNAIIRVFYYSDPDISTCWANFFSSGFTMQEQTTALGFPSVATQITTHSEIGENYWYYDPLAQTFLLPEATYISAVGLFFKSKSSTLGYRVEMWRVENGVPVMDSNTPYAMKHLTSSEIAVSNDASAETVFTFDNVLAYDPSQNGTDFRWCFVGFPDHSNTDYSLWCSEVGTVDVITGQRITTHPNAGTLLHSPNAASWSSEQPWSKRDLKFKLYKSNFEDDCRIEFNNLSGVQAAQFIMKFDEYVGSGTNVRWFYSTDNGVTFEAFNPYIDQDFGDVIDQVTFRADVTSLGGSYEIIDKYVGIYLRYFNEYANYISRNEFFTDPLLYPNKISASFAAAADNINSGVGTLVTAQGSIDDGNTWFVIPQKEGYTPVADIDPYYIYRFETPDEATITDATNASPIVVTSAGHGFTDGMIVTIDSVTGNTNANGDWVVTNVNVTNGTFELYTTGGIASSGNSAYVSGGKINLKEFTQFRGRVQLSTSLRHRTPRVRKIAFLTATV